MQDKAARQSSYRCDPAAFTFFLNPSYFQFILIASMHFSSIALLLPSLALAVVVSRNGHYPPEVPTFDPVEYFKDKQLDRPTITAYRACPPRVPLNSNRTVPLTCNTTWLSSSALPVPRLSREKWYIDNYLDLTEKLTWKGAKKAYPLLIGLEEVTYSKPTRNRMEIGVFLFSMVFYFLFSRPIRILTDAE